MLGVVPCTHFLISVFQTFCGTLHTFFNIECLSDFSWYFTHILFQILSTILYSNNMAYQSTRSPRGKLLINFCREQEFMVLPGVGKKIAKTIAKFRDMNGNITESSIYDIRRFTPTDMLLKMIDFTPNTAYEQGDMMTGDVSPITKQKQEDPLVFQQRMLQLIDNKIEQSRVEVKDENPQYSRAPERSSGSKPQLKGKPSPALNKTEAPEWPSGAKAQPKGKPPPAFQQYRDIRYRRPSQDTDSEDEGDCSRNQRQRYQRAYMTQDPDSDAEEPPIRRGRRDRNNINGDPYSDDEDFIRRPSQGRRKTESKKRRPAYSPGGTPSRTLSDDDDDDDIRSGRLRGKQKPVGSKKRRPAYSPGGTPSRILSDDDDDDNRSGRHSGKQKPVGFKPAAIPKGLTYDGKTNWSAFKRKFVRYAAASNWTEEECLDALCWCLIGKASDFYALMAERDEDVSYFKLLDKMEKRFGTRELPETLIAKFSQIVQNQDEDLEDWVDRIQTLAIKAFKGLPDTHMTKQMIVRFCQGCYDKEAGQSACNARPLTLDKAIDHIRWFQYTHQAIYRSSRAKEPRRSQGADCDRVSRTTLQQEKHWGNMENPDSDSEFLSVRATGEDTKKWQGNRRDGESNRLKALEDNMARVLSGLEKMATEVTKLNNRRTSRSPSPGRLSCFFCGAEGHFKKDCPVYKEKLAQEKHVTFSDDLNQSGSDSKATPRPGQ